MVGGRTKSRARAALAGVLGALMLVTCTSLGARAADEDEDEGALALDKKIMNSILGGLGVQTGPEIEYRERSPLVVPPKLDLPPPETGALATRKDPAWPVDADVKRRKQSKSAERRGIASDEMHDDAKPVSPDALSRGRRAGSGQGNPVDDSGRRLTQSELGAKSIFDLKASWFGFGYSEESGSFDKEPPRTSLIQPPVGYQTPSAAQPYGVGAKKNESKPATIYDRGTDMR
jgi:hypothetical protein